MTTARPGDPSEMRQTLGRPLLLAGLCLLVVAVVSVLVNRQDPALDADAFNSPVTVEAVVVDAGETREGGAGTVCAPTYRFELDGSAHEATAATTSASLCAESGTSLKVTVDAADPTRVVAPALERSLATSSLVGFAAAFAMLAAGALLRRRR